MKTYQATTSRPEKLLDELLASALPAAIKAALRVEGTGSVTISAPDETDDGTVNAVIAAHNPNTPGAGEQADAERMAATTDIGEQYAAAITRLNQIIDFVGTPTAPQVYDAVQDIALYLRKTLRYLEAQRGG